MYPPDFGDKSQGRLLLRTIGSVLANFCCQLNTSRKNYHHQISLWPCLWDIPLMAKWCWRAQPTVGVTVLDLRKGAWAGQERLWALRSGQKAVLYLRLLLRGPDLSGWIGFSWRQTTICKLTKLRLLRVFITGTGKQTRMERMRSNSLSFWVVPSSLSLHTIFPLCPIYFWSWMLLHSSV